MVTACQNLPRFTPEEYLVWEEQQEFRYEYLGGEIYAMTGGSVNHGQIAANLIAVLVLHLRGSSCRVLTSDVKVETQKSHEFVYPDVSVTCDDRDLAATKFISHPCLIVEVLSPSTEAYDRGGKFKLYQQSTSFRDYVLVNSNKIEVDLYRKDDLHRWEIISYGLGDLIELQSINLTFPIEQIFEGINIQ
jgi:Uma2 family endonuclease